MQRLAIYNIILHNTNEQKKGNNNRLKVLEY